MTTLPLIAMLTCLATPVGHGFSGETVVRAGPIVGYIAPGYDVVRGRFSLHVGDTRDEQTGLSQKIPWYAPPDSGAGASLVVTGTRLGRPAGSFTQTFANAGLFPPGYVFPSIISPPSAGCWRLTFTSGAVNASLTVLVRR